MFAKLLLIYVAIFSIAVLAVVFLPRPFSFSNNSRPMPTTPVPQVPLGPNLSAVASSSKPNQNPKLNPTPAVVLTSERPSSKVSFTGTQIMAWIYPGAPTCGASSEYSDGRKIDVLKPEYFVISSDTGELTLLTEGEAGCNGYSRANIAQLKKYSRQQYVTISSSYAVTMATFLESSLRDNSDIETLVSFVVDNNLTGIEIDFEDFGGWDATMYSNYKRFIADLGKSLHQHDKKLMIDGPATSNATEETWYVWRYADFNSLPVDQLVVMTYDYQFDQGVGEPVSPLSWIQNTMKWTLGKFPHKSKLVFGIPSYGYKGATGTQKFSLLTYEQLKKQPGFDTAVRDSGSAEMTWQNDGYTYFYQDSLSMTKKLQTIQNIGITSVSVWHLGGNLWF